MLIEINGGYFPAICQVCLIIALFLVVEPSKSKHLSDSISSFCFTVALNLRIIGQKNESIFVINIFEMSFFKNNVIILLMEPIAWNGLGISF